MYITLAAQTERTWFDRRLAWDSYSAQFVYDTGMFAAKLQGAISATGPEDFTLVDSRIDIYGYYPEQLETLSIGGGLSYFDCNPYTGFEFLDDIHLAAFVDVQYLVFEAKFAMLIGDDFYNGGLFEIKLYNALLYSAFEYQNRLKMDPASASILRFIMPSEIGLTSAFGLPGDNDGWGWFVKNRYVFLRFSSESTTTYINNKDRLTEEQNIWGMCVETYWAYKGGISNNNVSQSWEFGIKITLVGF